MMLGSRMKESKAKCRENRNLNRRDGNFGKMARYVRHWEPGRRETLNWGSLLHLTLIELSS
jgi:hypothetical protein